MAKNSIAAWSPTADSNTDIGGVDINEGCAPAGINNAIRQVMKQGADMFATSVAFSDAQAGQARANIGTSLMAGYRNKIINGDFDIWQRGTAIAMGSGYGPDGWRFLPSGGGLSCTAEKVAGSPGTGPAYYGRFTISGTGTAASRLQQRIEGVQTLAGKVATFRALIGMGAAQTVNIWLRQHFGTGGSPSSDVTTVIGAYEAGIGFTTECKMVVTVPSISGKTLGSDGNDYLEIFLEITEADAQTLYLSHVSLTEGDNRTELDAFSPRHIQQELALCHRYYRVLDGLGMGGYAPIAGASAIVPVVIAPMRATPAQSISIIATANMATYDINMAANGVGDMRMSSTDIGSFSTGFNVALSAEL